MTDSRKQFERDCGASPRAAPTAQRGARLSAGGVILVAGVVGLLLLSGWIPVPVLNLVSICR